MKPKPTLVFMGTLFANSLTSGLPKTKASNMKLQ
jgi:hypothetical protein